MGRRQQRKKTRKTKIYANSRMPGLQTKKLETALQADECQPRMVACGKRINGIEERKVDYNSMSKTGKAALDNVIYLTGRTKDEILKEERT